MPTGMAVLNFGATPGTNIVSTVVTGQASIVAGSLVEAWLNPTPTSDHNIEELNMFSVHVGVLAHSIAAGVGFTITATTELRLTGTINVSWVWA